MKKFLALTLILGALASTSVHAQAPNDPAAMLQGMKEKITPRMVEKTGITEAQANRIVEINFEMRQNMAAHQDLSPDERNKKMAELKADRDKKWAEVLTQEQIKSVKAFYEEMGKDAQRKVENKQ